jgi:predicted HTH domain antitoxin
MNTVTIDLPEMTFAALGKTPKDLGREILVAAVIKWFELGKISQGKAAEILGISRTEFLDVLSNYCVSAWQYTKEDLDEELSLD